MVSTKDSESFDPSSSLGRTSFLYFINFFEIKYFTIFNNHNDRDEFTNKNNKNEKSNVYAINIKSK